MKERGELIEGLQRGQNFFRNLINEREDEVEELRRKNADREEVVRRQVGWYTELEAEVKELREENADSERYRDSLREALRADREVEDRLRDQLSVEELASRNKIEELEATIKQMEGALREIAAGPYNGFEQCKAIARDALGE